MSEHQELYDEAMFAFSSEDYDRAIAGLQELLTEDPSHFDAQLALGMAYYRKGDYPTAIAEGRKAEQMKPHEQLVHTNLSLFYMKSGDKVTAEHHGLQARIASWRADAEASKSGEKKREPGDPELQMVNAKPQNITIPSKFPDMPWKKKPPATGS